MLDDIDVDCLSCSQNRHPQDGANVLDWLSGRGQSFLCFTLN